MGAAAQGTGVGAAVVQPGRDFGTRPWRGSWEPPPMAVGEVESHAGIAAVSAVAEA